MMYQGLFACKNHAVIYANVPKSACTTIKNLMYFADCGVYYDRPLFIHGDASALIKGKDSPDAMEKVMRQRKLVFSMVRHPYKRIYSCFNEKVFHRSPHSFGKLRGALVEKYGLDFSENDYSLDKHEDNFRRFLKFVQANLAGDQSLFRKDPHWGLQSKMLRRMGGVLNIDFVGRVEDFKKDMSFISSYINADVDLTKKFNEARPPYSYNEVLSVEVAGLLESVYEDDMAYFGYE